MQGTQGLTERVLVIRQQFENLTPGYPDRNRVDHELPAGNFPTEPSPVISVQPGQAGILARGECHYEAFLTLQIQFGTTPQQLEVLAIDGIPLQ